MGARLRSAAATALLVAVIFSPLVLGLWLRSGFYNECRAVGFTKLYCLHIAAAKS